MPAIDLNHVSISTRDFDESLRFYTEFLGLEHIATPVMSVRVEWLRVGQRQVHLFPASEPAPDRHHLAFEIDNFEELFLASAEQLSLIHI